MIQKLRTSMLEQKLDMLVVVSADEHLNEYLPVQNCRLRASTSYRSSQGFRGSAGTAVFCVEGRHQLFVDSRYHIQAEQSCGEIFEIQKLGNDGVLAPQEWIASHLGKTLIVGADPYVMSPNEWRRYENNVKKAGHILKPTTPNLVDTVWDDRPNSLKNNIYPLDIKYTGKSSSSKLEDVRKEINESGMGKHSKADVLLLTMLDEIAWLTNLRGSDIEHTPVFEAYAAIFQERALCFCHHPDAELSKFCPDWEFRPYDEYKEFVERLSKDENVKILIDPSKITMGTYMAFSKEQIIEQKSPILLAKALKNPAEINSTKNAHKQAGVGVIKSFRRLQKAIDSGQPVTEKQYSDWLYEAYAQAEGFSELSFKTISGSGANGAIVHYGTPDDSNPMKKGDLLLVDSGIQCAGGTTDATRTVILGNPSEKQKRIFTLVLQAHIRLARQIFPEGTKGSSLDSITRSGLWNEGLNYGHGTGHGVGSFLNVHEGPQRISPFAYDVGLEEGMVLSNEPGYYEHNWGGIRLENLYVIKKSKVFPKHSDGKGWLAFETLTLIPFERRLIDRDILSVDELKWLDEYHQLVFNEISPMLTNSEDLKWLIWACGLV